MVSYLVPHGVMNDPFEFVHIVGNAQHRPSEYRDFVRQHEVVPSAPSWLGNTFVQAKQCLIRLQFHLDALLWSWIFIPHDNNVIHIPRHFVSEVVHGIRYEFFELLVAKPYH